MSEHKWLTEKEIEQFEKEVADVGGWWKPRVKRLIADRREMRELLASCEPQLPRCTRDQEDIEYMLEATDAKS